MVAAVFERDGLKGRGENTMKLDGSSRKSSEDPQEGHDNQRKLDKSSYQGKAQFYKNLMEFEEVRGGKSAGYWASHVSRFGVEHLINPHHSMGWVELYDLDIQAYICAALLSLYLAYCFMTRVKSFTPKQQPT